VAAKGAPIQNAIGRDSGCVLVLRDVTEEYELRESLNQSHKLEAIGQLAGGVAHDFNNLLTGIMGSVDLLLDDSLSQGSRELAKNILDASNQARDLTRQLLDFGRKGRAPSRLTEVHPVLEEVAATLETGLDPSIDLALHLDAPCSMVRGDQDQLTNALLNLVLNARDAILKLAGDGKAGGLIEIKTYNRLLDSRSCASLDSVVLPGEHLEICIRDTGIGMSPATQARIFEPFFTTKDGGRGPGLGLAGVYGCVRSHGGGIRVQSTQGQGTTIHMYLPILPNSEELEETTLQPFTKKRGHILLVDDEVIILKMTKLVLERNGYTVSTCADGAEAVEYFTKHHQSVDLALMDVVMPRLSGVDAFKRMQTIDASVPVVLTSGYTNDRSEADLIALGTVGFLPKPYGVRELTSMISKALQKALLQSAAENEKSTSTGANAGRGA
jgi:signal transduction histidine kinase/CheY-like chemotaxis protein